MNPFDHQLSQAITHERINGRSLNQETRQLHLSARWAAIREWMAKNQPSTPTTHRAKPATKAGF